MYDFFRSSGNISMVKELLMILLTGVVPEVVRRMFLLEFQLVWIFCLQSDVVRV